MSKKPILKILLFAIPVILMIFLLLVALRPPEFRVARSITINAPPEVIFPHVNELKLWEAWNPWGKLDPNMKLTYAGPPAGVGASYAWAGNNDVGEGRAAITESRTNELVQFKMEWLKPMSGVSTVEFTFKPQGNQTEVTWSMTGKNNFIARAFCLFMNMDKMIGGQFEKGLADMKTIAETPAKP